jgi:hypothetical protein
MIKRPSNSREWKTDQSRQTEDNKIDRALSNAIEESMAALALKLSVLAQKQNASDA